MSQSKELPKAMAKYKIIIRWDGTYYLAILYKRKWWFLWEVLEYGSSFLPISPDVERWMKDFNIPDNQVKIYQ